MTCARVPFFTSHGGYAVPPPGTSGKGEHVRTHVSKHSQFCSCAHRREQPSPGMTLPSSHASPASLTPLPHDVGAESAGGGVVSNTSAALLVVAATAVVPGGDAGVGVPPGRADDEEETTGIRVIWAVTFSPAPTMADSTEARSASPVGSRLTTSAPLRTEAAAATFTESPAALLVPLIPGGEGAPSEDFTRSRRVTEVMVTLFAVTPPPRAPATPCLKARRGTSPNSACAARTTVRIQTIATTQAAAAIGTRCLYPATRHAKSQPHAHAAAKEQVRHSYDPAGGMSYGPARESRLGPLALHFEPACKAGLPEEGAPADHSLQAVAGDD